MDGRLPLIVQVVLRPEQQNQGLQRFKTVVVERTFGWLDWAVGDSQRP